MPTKPKAPLGLDDIAVYGPDRDRERVFDPAATWLLATNAVEKGYAPDEVAALLHELPAADWAALMRRMDLDAALVRAIDALARHSDETPP